MKTLLPVFVVFLSFSAVSQDELPKECFGFYAGEMAAYTVMKNDIEMSIERHDVEVHVTNEYIAYSSGTVVLKGAYTFLKQTGNQYLIKAELSNGKNISYQLDLLWDKKRKTLFLAGRNGEPDLYLERLEN